MDCADSIHELPESMRTLDESIHGFIAVSAGSVLVRAPPDPGNPACRRRVRGTLRTRRRARRWEWRMQSIEIARDPKERPNDARKTLHSQIEQRVAAFPPRRTIGR